MKEWPILMNAPMVCATLDGSKTQTRRLVKWRPKDSMCSTDCRGESGEQWADRGGGAGGYLKVGCRDGASQRIFCPYGLVGDRLWVRETWAPHDESAERDFVYYRADDLCRYDTDGRWKPSIHMPRWASRITLEVTEVRVERLQSISEEDAKAEGITAKFYSEHRTAYDPETEGCPSFPVEPDAGYISKHGLENVRHHPPKPILTAVEGFRSLWGSINGNWAANPWVWAISFRRIP